jgi:hypothetical protein
MYINDGSAVLGFGMLSGALKWTDLLSGVLEWMDSSS